MLNTNCVKNDKLYYTLLQLQVASLYDKRILKLASSYDEVNDDSNYVET